MQFAISFYSLLRDRAFLRFIQHPFFIKIKYGFFLVILEWVKAHIQIFGKNSLALRL